MLTLAIASEEELTKEPAEDLLSLQGMTPEWAQILARHGVVTREDLAEQSVEDLLEMSDIPAAQAAELIMKARAHWFAEEAK